MDYHPFNCRKNGKTSKKQKNRFPRNSKKLCNGAASLVRPSEYAFYSILNTNLRMNQGTAAALIAQGLIALYAALDSDHVKSEYIEAWLLSGRTIIILKGYDHKHLKHLEEEVKFTAIKTHAVRKSWGQNRAIVTLAVFGQQELLEEAFEGLSYLR